MGHATNEPVLLCSEQAFWSPTLLQAHAGSRKPAGGMASRLQSTVASGTPGELKTCETCFATKMICLLVHSKVHVLCVAQAKRHTGRKVGVMVIPCPQYIKDCQIKPPAGLT